MKRSKIFQKMMGLMLTSASVVSLACVSVAYAAPSSETFAGSDVKRINVVSVAKNVNIEASTDNSIHVSSAATVKQSGTALVVTFADNSTPGTIQIPTSATDVSIQVRAAGKAENVTVKNIALKDITINAVNANVVLDDVTVPKAIVQSTAGDITIDAKGLKTANAFSRAGDVSVSTDATDIISITAKSLTGDAEAAAPGTKARSAEETSKVHAISVQGKAEVKTK